jgi:tetratricopeptide (TPR) repeat protein
MTGEIPRTPEECAMPPGPRPRLRLAARPLVSGVVSLLLLATAPALARAAGGGGGGGGGPVAAPARPEDPDYTAGVRAIKAGQYTEAIALLERVVARDGANADALNWLAYAVRRSGDPARSIPIYQRALAVDPRHRGAHEYIGEAYLALGDLARAKEHLARLDRLCVLPCSEYRDLKRAIEAYEKGGGRVRPSG